MIELLADSVANDCLLVVDDQESNLRELGGMLGKVGFEVVPAASAAEALEKLACRQPDLILLDLLLPAMEGFDLCRRIQEDLIWSDIPIIFLSESDDKELIVRALESGGVDYITRPFDMSELVSRVRTQLMLKTTRDHLSKLARDKEELLGIISHHLQNHFASVEMSAQVLLNRTKDSAEPNQRLVSEIRNASSRMRAFVKSFLANAAADHKLEIKPETTSLADAAHRVVRQYEAAAQAKGIQVHLELQEQDPPVRADVCALAQVLDNLTSNAVKFSPLGREVKIAVRWSADKVECRVKDQGPGFTEKDKAQMFGRYARLSARPTGGEPSTGLGLNIARKLAQAMGASLLCESEPGRGAEFILQFPRSDRIPLSSQ